MRIGMEKTPTRVDAMIDEAKRALRLKRSCWNSLTNAAVSGG
jgi:hypothetical protein